MKECRSLPQPPDAQLMCAWCHTTFDTIVELLAHVDRAHLDSSNDTTPDQATHRPA
jgi:hypothetical protein